MAALPLLPKEPKKDADRELAENLCSLQIPYDIQLSPNGGGKVLYSTSELWQSSPEKHTLSTLWLASTGQASSSRKLTSGRFNDLSPRWSPDGSLIAFISDREKRGESCAIYVVPMQEGGAEPSPITEAANQAGFDTLWFSPNGKEILYLSADEKTEEKKKEVEDETDGPRVWGEDWEHARIRIVDVETKQVKCLTGGMDRHILTACWSHDGRKIAFTHTSNPNIEEPWLSGTKLSTLDIESREIKDLCFIPDLIADLHWQKDEKLYFRLATTIGNDYGSQALYTVDLSASKPELKKEAYGVDSDCDSLVFASGEAFVQIDQGLRTQIHLHSSGKILLDKACNIDAWDAAFSSDGNEAVLAVMLSDIDHPDEVYTITASGGPPVQLSNHGAAFKDRTFGSWKHLTCRSGDDKVDLDAIFITPTKPKASNDSPQPTFVMIHGGPTDRNTPSFDSYYFMWAPYILSRGYSVLLPQYRGSSGRGDAFGMWSIEGAGKYDHADVITLTDHAIKEGLVDKSKVLAGGWSQGGFISYLCSTRNGRQGLGWKFQATIAGAGVTDCDAMAMESDLGSTHEPILNGGHAPWNMDTHDTRHRGSSALWEVKGAVAESKRTGEFVIPPILILHGEKDERCPLPQAEAFRRALTAHGLPYEYVVYPRQGHSIEERRSRIDMLLRIGRWCDTHIGSQGA